MLEASHYQLDTCGLRCPEPIMLLRQQLRAMHPGEVTEMVADDPTTQRDVPNFCRFIGHRLLRTQIDRRLYFYLIEKGDSSPKRSAYGTE